MLSDVMKRYIRKDTRRRANQRAPLRATGMVTDRLIQEKLRPRVENDQRHRVPMRRQHERQRAVAGLPDRRGREPRDVAPVDDVAKLRRRLEAAGMREA